MDINLFELQTAKQEIFYILFNIKGLVVYEFRTPFLAAYMYWSAITGGYR